MAPAKRGFRRALTLHAEWTDLTTTKPCEMMVFRTTKRPSGSLRPQWSPHLGVAIHGWAADPGTGRGRQ
jgi:hypothetical protein